jgi:hypothetical protein
LGTHGSQGVCGCTVRSSITPGGTAESRVIAGGASWRQPQWVAEIAPLVRQQQPFAWPGALDAVLP